MAVQTRFKKMLMHLEHALKVPNIHPHMKASLARREKSEKKNHEETTTVPASKLQ